MKYADLGNVESKRTKFLLLKEYIAQKDTKTLYIYIDDVRA